MEKSFLRDLNEHQGIILKVCSMYCDDRDDSEDLFQEIVLQLWKSYSGFKGEAKLSTWMYRVALNTAITRLRKTKRRPDKQRLDNDNFNIAEVANNRLDIQFSAELQQAINMLNRFDRALMMLYYLILRILSFFPSTLFLSRSKDMEQLELILKQKTSGVLNKVKTRYGRLISYILIVISFTLIFTGFLPWLMGQEVPVYTWPTTLDRALSMLVSVFVALTFVFFYWLKYTAMEAAVDGEDIKQAVKKNIEKLRRSLGHEVLFVITLFFGWVTVARFNSQVSGHGEFWDILHLDILVAIGALAVLLGVYLIVRYRQYKKYISELKGYLEEFEKA